MKGSRSREWQQALQASDARLSAIIDSAMDAIVSLDDEQTIVVFNRAAERMLRITRAEALGESIARFIPERVRARYEGFLRTFEPRPERPGTTLTSLLALRADGQEFPAEAAVSQVTAAGQKVVTIILRDVTERVRMETRLHLLVKAGAVLSSSLEYEGTVAALVDLVVPTLAEWCVVHLAEEDGSIRRLAAAHPDPELLRKSQVIAERFPADPDFPLGVPRVIRTGEPELYREISKSLFDTFPNPEQREFLHEVAPVSAIIVPLGAHGSIRGALSLFTSDPSRRFDDEDLALAQELGGRAGLALENARLYRELQAADRRKDQFLAMLAHELRNPLSAISNSLQVLRQAPPGHERALRAQEIIERQVAHQARLMDDLLEVTRLARNRVELHRHVLDLVSLVRHTVEDHRRDIEASGHRLVLDLPQDPVPVDADATRLAQVLGNLLHNARKFTPAGGQLTVAVQTTPKEVSVSVTDTGIGIPADVLPLIFDVFSQGEQSLERSQGGLGLGLALVRRLVELHGGRVAARSVPGEGSTFEFWLPLSRATLDATLAGPQRSRGPSRRILLVEDNPGAAESLRDLLDLLGHQVAVAQDGLEGLRLAASFRPEVVLCDLGLPGLDGYEVARHVRRDPTMAGLRLVALTGYGQDEARRRSAEAGFDLHLTKPLRLEDLEDVLGSPDRPTVQADGSTPAQADPGPGGAGPV